MYDALFRTALARTDPETAHHRAVDAIRLAGRVPRVSPEVARRMAPADPVLRVSALGLEFPGPLGLAAGFDKDARAIDGLATMGFGHVEVGTVTAQPQPGNPRPRLFRLVQDRAIVNRMGFNNSGSAAVAARLLERRARTHVPVVVGVNIGKTKVVPESEAAADYALSAQRLAPLADYLVVNVSSPNTPGLRDLQAVDHLRPILSAVRAAADESAGRRVPLLVKIAPDLADDDVRAVADLALELGLEGIVATNTTISRDGLRTNPGQVSTIGAGGLSGPVLGRRSLEVLRLLRARVGDRLVLVSVGGICTPDDAWARIRAGATLLQGYTGFIYGGPLWARRMHNGLARRAQLYGFASVADAIGTAEQREYA